MRAALPLARSAWLVFAEEADSSPSFFLFVLFFSFHFSFFFFLWVLLRGIGGCVLSFFLGRYYLLTYLLTQYCFCALLSCWVVCPRNNNLKQYRRYREPTSFFHTRETDRPSPSSFIRPLSFLSHTRILSPSLPLLLFHSLSLSISHSLSILTPSSYQFHKERAQTATAAPCKAQPAINSRHGQ